MSFAPISLSRTKDGEVKAVELRGECPRLTVDVLDAISTARRMSRTELVNEVLHEFVQQQLREASLVARITRGNPEVAELFPGAAE